MTNPPDQTMTPMPEDKTIKCPHCDEDIKFNATVKQCIGVRTGITLTPKKGTYLTAIVVGESIASYARLLDSCAEKIGPHKTVQILEKIETDGDGAITATFITALAEVSLGEPVQETLPNFPPTDSAGG